MDRETKEIYSLRATELSEQYRSANVEHLHQRLKKLVVPEAHVLDLGCGAGREAAFLLSCGARVWGADASPEMLQEAQKAFCELRGRLLQLSLPARLPFNSACFDLLICISVLMHLELQDLPGVFAELKRILKPCGRMVFSVPLSRPDITNGRDPLGRRFNQLSAQNWKILAMKAGFVLAAENVETDGLGRQSTSWVTLEYILGE